MVKKIDGLRHVKAWLSPTAFWPAFNKITAPGLLCVPDVLLAEFPIGFAREPELFRNFENVERTIRGAHSFVTYSTLVKWNTLVDRYMVRPEEVAVVPHACWDLSPWIKVTGFSDEDCATKAYCESLLQQALCRLGTDDYTKGLQASSLKFLFYPSQFRPNKNVVLLIEAYEKLLRERFTHHKLILTGDPNRYPPVLDFVRGRGLTKDVLFLSGLNNPELAACYRLADLAINPSLSEGGCPFTFTEALSVEHAGRDGTYPGYGRGIGGSGASGNDVFRSVRLSGRLLPNRMGAFTIAMLCFPRSERLTPSCANAPGSMLSLSTLRFSTTWRTPCLH